MANLATAIRIASVAFEKTIDKGGHPYMLHCFRVMDGVKHLGEKAMICAVLHDLLEDCEDWTGERLMDEGFSWDIVTILLLLKHNREMPYMDYIKALSIHPIATAIKLSDIKDNSDITRLKGLRKKDHDRMEKYATAYTYLKDCHIQKITI